jgi:hypothetical protein
MLKEANQRVSDVFLAGDAADATGRKFKLRPLLGSWCSSMTWARLLDAE